MAARVSISFRIVLADGSDNLKAERVCHYLPFSDPFAHTGWLHSAGADDPHKGIPCGKTQARIWVIEQKLLHALGWLRVTQRN
jgi:hypothetical protein